MRKLFLCLAFFLLISSSLFCASIRLLNDSPYKLRAVIRGADGTYLGEIVLLAQSSITWGDTHGYSGFYNGGNYNERNASRAQTPYTVIWYCLAGDDYAVCSNVASGSLVRAQECTGKRSCSPTETSPTKYPRDEPEGHYLHQSQQAQKGATNP